MQQFNIQEYVDFNERGRASCPCCETLKGKPNTNLSLVPGTDGAYKCFRGCTPEDIRSTLGVQRNRQIPAAHAAATPPAAKTTVSPQKVREAHETLVESKGAAKQWLHNRGITDGLIQRYDLGIARAKTGDKYLPSITIPIPSDDGTLYWQKKRVAPWLTPEELKAKLGESYKEYKPWSQYGIPARSWFSWKPAEATATILCEGEWDAMLLGQMMREANQAIAVASFTCGCGNVPKDSTQLDVLPGTVYICYDHDTAGEKGAQQAATALGNRSRIMTCPIPTSIASDDQCDTDGWDISDAINNGSSLGDFLEAMKRAIALETKPAKAKGNPLWERLISNDDLMDSAPDYTEWLVPDLLTANELFLVAAGPRAGKSLLAMTLTLAVAQGSTFLGRPVMQGAVLYVCLEDSAAKLKEREASQGWTRGLPVHWLKKFKLSELHHLKEIAEELDPRLIVIDTLSRAKDASVSESSAEMSQVLEPLQEIAEALECCVLLVHHTGKVSVDNASQVDIFDTIRGSSAIRAVCRGSMVIAAGERDYRLVAENGWGKHDLKVVLDGNTQTWKLLGQWSPTENTSQKEQILDYLKKTKVATLEQIHDGTGIPKKSLYEQLSRLQASEILDEKVAKEGSRRKYTYRLALFNTIQQLNSVLNSRNADSDDDRSPIQQKNDFSYEGDHSESMQTGTCDTLHTFSDHPLPPTKAETVEYRPSNPDTASVTPIQQLFNTPLGESPSNPDTADDSRYSTRYSTTETTNTKSMQTGTCDTQICTGDRVRYVGEVASLKRVCGAKWLEVLQVSESEAIAKHSDWAVSQKIPLVDLQRRRRVPGQKAEG